MSLALGIAANLVVGAPVGSAHPTYEELREEFEERAQCEAGIGADERIDMARLGMSQEDLLQAVPGLRRDPPTDAADAADADTDGGAALVRWVGAATDALAGVDYELWRGRVYRIRWRLPDEFERPVMDELNRRARICFGLPEYDQTFEAEPGSPKATLRRILWKHGDRQIELRQLHPLRGGRVYLSVTSRNMLREIGAAGLAPFPDPDRSEPWWRREAKTLVPATDSERERIGRDFARYLSQLDH